MKKKFQRKKLMVVLGWVLDCRVGDWCGICPQLSLLQHPYKTHTSTHTHTYMYIHTYMCSNIPCLYCLNTSKKLSSHSLRELS